MNVSEQLAIALQALEDIKVSGRIKPGHGYTCFRIANTALEEIKAVPIPDELVERAKSLTEGMEVDLDAPIIGKVNL